MPARTDEASAHLFIRTLRHTLYDLEQDKGIRLVGDTDHRKKLEAGTASTEQDETVPARTDGGRERTGDSGSKIRDAMLQAVLQQGMGDHPAKFEEGTPGGRLRETGDVKAARRENQCRAARGTKQTSRQTAGELSAVREELQQVASDSPSVPELEQKLKHK